MRAPRWSVAATMVAVLLTLVACSEDKPEEPARPLDTTPAPGSVVVSDEATGFAVSIPESWVQLPTDIGGFDAAADRGRAEAPPDAAAAVAIGLVQLKSAVRSGVVLAAIDPRTGETANLVTLADQGQTAQEISVGAANQLSQNGATDLARQTITVDGVETVRQRFRTPLSGDTGPVTVTETQFYAVRRGEAFILTLVGESPVIDSIGTSLKLA